MEWKESKKAGTKENKESSGRKFRKLPMCDRTPLKELNGNTDRVKNYGRGNFS